MPEKRYDVYLEVFVGPMFSGKTSKLLERLQIASELYKGKVAYIGHSNDASRRFNSEESRQLLSNSDEKKCITTHSFEFSSVKNCDIIYNRFLNEIKISEDVRAIAIDEAQFFDGEDLLQTVKKWLKLPFLLEIYVAGLDGNYKQEIFTNSGIHHLLPLANVFKKLNNAVCFKCFQEEGKRKVASFTTLKNEELLINGEILVGGSGEWMSVCRRHLYN